MEYTVAQNGQKANSLAGNLEFSCKEHMAQNNFIMDEPLLIDGQLHRISTDANKSKRDEWYIAYHGVSDRGREYLIVIYGTWVGEQKYMFSSWDTSQGDDPTEQEIAGLRRDLELRKQEASRNFHQNKEFAASTAGIVWNEATTKPTELDHLAYIAKKGIEPIGCRFTTYKQIPAVVIPVYDVNRRIRSLQFLYKKDEVFDKRFLRHGEVEGNFCPLVAGRLSDSSRVYICEGWATGVSIYLALDKKENVIAALSAGNIPKVMKVLKEKYPHLECIVCPDNDANGVGQNAGLRAVRTYGGLLVLPQGYNDFNDVHVALGVQEVRKQLEQTQTVTTITQEMKLLAQQATTQNLDFDINLLPIPLKKYIKSLSTTTDAHPLMLLSSVLTMLAAYVGNNAYIAKPEYFQDLYPNLWMLCISKSGEFKTTALNAGSAIARKQQAQVKKDMTNVRASMVQRRASEAEITQELAHLERKLIILPHRSTMEALMDQLQGCPAGVLQLSEFGAFLKNLSKNYQADTMGTLTDLYDVPFEYTMRTAGKGLRTIERPAISICGVSTIDWLKEAFKDSDLEGGFLIRFMVFIIPTSDKIPPAFPQAKPAEFAKSEDEFEAVINRIKLSIAHGRQMTISPTAKQLYTQYYESIVSTARTYDSSIYHSFSKRWAPQVLKIAIIMELLFDPDSTEISMQAIASAYEVVKQAIKCTKQLLDGDLLADKSQQDSHKLLNYIARKIAQSGNPVTKRDLLRGNVLKVPERFKKVVDYYDEILDLLVQQGKISIEKNKNKSQDKFSLAVE